MGEDLRARLGELFDRTAPGYDADTSVEFYRPVGRRLVELVAPARGAHVLDVGCGRGAVSFPAAIAVGPEGRVHGIDLADGMVQATAAEAAEHGLTQLVLTRMDGQRPDFPDATFDVVLAGMSLMMLADLPAALRAYAGLLRPGGRLGFSTPALRSVEHDESFGAVLSHRQLTELRTADQAAAESLTAFFESNELYHEPDRLADLVAAAGFENVTVLDEHAPMWAASGRHFVDWSFDHGMRLLWEAIPEPRRDAFRAEVVDLVEACEPYDGGYLLPTPVRYVTAQAPA